MHQDPGHGAARVVILIPEPRSEELLRLKPLGEALEKKSGLLPTIDQMYHYLNMIPVRLLWNLQKKYAAGDPT